jgi:bis(5'-nucleosyl)-tetraphosphatase (symmetrical)
LNGLIRSIILKKNNKEQKKMSTYAIGDVQGCYDELQALLAEISFNPSKDQLWFAGDLVNRGPKSLQVLRFIKNLPNAIVVLGNHDIHLLALANGHPFPSHTLHEVLAAPDRQELIDWLRQQPFLHYDANLNCLMSHAGLFPRWSLSEAQTHAQSLEQVLRADDYAECLAYLYGNEPSRWTDHLTGWDKLRFIMNAFTRMRFCTMAGELDFSHTGEIGTQPADYFPWFEIPKRSLTNFSIMFGHWAALKGKTSAANVYALDTGCAWGGALTALRLEDKKQFMTPALKRAAV